MLSLSKHAPNFSRFAALRQAQGDKPTPFKILFQQPVRGALKFLRPGADFIYDLQGTYTLKRVI